MSGSSARRMRTWAITLVVVAAGQSAAAQTTGPSSSESPFLLPVAPGVETVSLLTVGDAPSGSPYRLVGIPDGMGAFDNGDGTFTILLNHELTSSSGVTRAHGATGAFVSRWTVDASTFEIIAGEDLIREVFIWNTATRTHEPSVAERFSRFCSGDLPAESAFYNAATGLGTRELIYTNGEETGSEGQAFAHIASGPNAGRSFDLPRCGKLSFENAVAAPLAGDVTVVVGLDDVTGGQIYVYVGRKTDSGRAIRRAGLTNGFLFGVAVDGLPAEIPANGLGGPTSLPFQLHEFGDVSAWSGSRIALRERPQRRDRVPAAGGRALGSAATWRFLLVYDRGERRPGAALAVAFRRHSRSGRGRDDRDAARRLGGCRQSGQFDGHADRPRADPGGSGQWHAAGSDLAV